ncbi:MAG: amino acid ABC transporter permease [Lachnospiraceae bacterium]|nr:amino acid ABC transporter permease [Lachnospiraceae bacterium]
MGQIFDIRLIPEYTVKLLSGIPTTLLLFILVTVLSLILGMAFALIKIQNIPFLYQIVAILISYARSVPGIVQLFVVFYGMPILIEEFTGVNATLWDPLLFVVIAYTFNTSVFFCEAMRTAIESLDKGQFEAGFSVGMSYPQVFIRIILPQAVRISLPTLEINACTMMKETALAYTIGVTTDIMGRATILGGRSYHLLEADISASILFLILNFILVIVFSRINKKFFTFKRKESVAV